MIKKIISVVCAALLAFGVCGCASSGNGGSSEVSSKTSSVNSSNSSQSQASSSVPNKTNTDRTLWQRKMVAITFDDGPQETNPQLLDILKEKNAKATFFMIGQNMEAHPEIVQRAIEEGHVVGYHSYEHKDLRNSSEKVISADFDKAQEIMDWINPEYKITYFRGPGGAASDTIKSEAAKRSWRIINWTNYGFNDHADQAATPEERVAGVFSDSIVANGSVLLIHPRDNQDILNGIALLIDRLQADGFECVTIQELLQRKNGGNAGEVYGSGTLIY